MRKLAKIQTIMLKKTDIRSLKRKGLFLGWNSITATWGEELVTASYMPGSRYISLSHASKNLSGAFEQAIELNSTPCHFGGSRRWFLCPLCNRRMAILYWKENRFGCRFCHKLSYASQSENRKSPLYLLLQTLKLNEKIEEILPQVKRENYAGKPTRKQQRLADLQREFLNYSLPFMD